MLLSLLWRSVRSLIEYVDASLGGTGFDEDVVSTDIWRSRAGSVTPPSDERPHSTSVSTRFLRGRTLLYNPAYPNVLRHLLQDGPAA